MSKTKIKKIDFIEFEEDSLPMILDIYDKEVDEFKRIIDKNIKEPEKDEYAHKEITTDNFGGVLVSSRVFVTKNNASFAEHISRFCKK